MTEIKFDKEEKARMVAKLQMYFNDELDHQLGQFDAEFFLDFLGEDIGSYFYNRGVFDAQAVLSQKIDDVSDAIYQLEKFVK